MREVVDETGRDPAEHRLPLLLSDVVLELHDPVGHAVEGLSQLVELVTPGNVDPLLEPALGDRLRATHEREDRADEGSAPVVADRDRGQQRQCDHEEEL